MLSYKQITILSWLIILNTVMSINQWSAIPIGNTFAMWLVNFLIVYYLLKEALSQRFLLVKGRYILCTIFLIWALLGSIRGIFVAENYWEYKQLVEGTLSLSLPLFAFAFADEEINLTVLKTWNKWITPLFFCFFIFVIPLTGYHFLIWPIFIYGIFARHLPKYWLVGIILLFALMTTVGITGRAQLIKVTVSTGLAFAFYFRNFLTERIIKLAHWGFYIGCIALLFLGITGKFNVFEYLEEDKGTYTTTRIDTEGNKVTEDVSDDTRTFIYQEVIGSAIKHDYIWTGRTPARGNDSFMFGKKIAEELGTGKYERHANEVCHLNVFTWLGLIGMILYSLIYLQASWLAIYRSNSYALKILGCFVAFHWALGWIEDQNRFDVSSIFLWMCIAMCLSERFRSMDDEDFSDWFYCIFHNEEYIPHDEIEEEYLDTDTNEQV